MFNHSAPQIHLFSVLTVHAAITISQQTRI